MAIYRHLNPTTMPPTRGYSHVVETTSPSRTIYLAGQLGTMPDGKFDKRIFLAMNGGAGRKRLLNMFHGHACFQIVLLSDERKTGS